MTIAFATCRHRPGLTASDQLVADALLARGARVEAVPWDAMPHHGEYELVCVRSTWDYHLQPRHFREWIGGFRENAGKLWNPAETLLWNMDKSYLRDVERRGIPIPLTQWVEPDATFDIQALLHGLGQERAVLKPRISASAHGTFLVTRGKRLPADELRLLQAHGALVQEFLPEVQSAGELSLLYVAGEFSHAVRKVAAPGDFRVQADHGGKVEPIEATDDIRAFGAQVLDAVSHPWIYARVDVVETARGPLLMELELIEPDLFLGYAPGSAGRLADALLARRVRDAA